MKRSRDRRVQVTLHPNVHAWAMELVRTGLYGTRGLPGLVDAAVCRLVGEELRTGLLRGRPVIHPSVKKEKTHG